MAVPRSIVGPGDSTARAPLIMVNKEEAGTALVGARCDCRFRKAEP
jgi:hypothetical protein